MAIKVTFSSNFDCVLLNEFAYDGIFFYDTQPTVSNVKNRIAKIWQKKRLLQKTEKQETYKGDDVDNCKLNQISNSIIAT